MSKTSAGLPKRVAVGVLAAALSVFGFALAGPAAASNHETSTERLAGATRFGTAADVCAQLNEDDGVDTVVIASGRNFPDALAAAPLAISEGGCVLLVEPDSLPQETLAALDEVDPSEVIIVGGTAAVSQGVQDAIEDEGFDTDRVAGDTREETAALVAERIGTAEDNTVILATGNAAPDALAAGGIAGGDPADGGVYPILLARGSLTPETEAAIEDLADEVIVVGGTAAVSEAAADQAGEAAGDEDVDRLAGETREGTARAIAEYALDELGYELTSIILATGRPPAEVGTFSPDALVAGPLAAARQAPILLTSGTDDLGTEAEEFLAERGGATTLVLCVGGTAVISNATCDAAAEAAEEAETPDRQVGLTDAPELESVTFRNLTSTGGTSNLGQLLVEACFDEEVLAAPIIANGFRIYNAYGEFGSSTQAQRNADDASCVDVLFNIGDAPFAISEGTVFTVVANTVQDAQGDTNPEGDLPGFIAQNFAAGRTRNPDLVSCTVVSGTQVDFVFDTGVQVLNAAGFRSVDTDGASRTSTAATVVSGTDPANTTVRATFPAAATTGGVLATTSRCGVLAGAVASTANVALTNPQQAEPAGGASGFTNSPDLVSVTFDPVNDRVTFTFDENIETLGADGNRTGFRVYYRLEGGQAREAISTSATDRSASDPRTVIAQFPAGAINELVAGASVSENSVYRDDPANDTPGGNTNPNGVDERGQASSFAAGDYLGPELVSAAVSDVTNVFGTVTSRRITYTFDQAINTPLTNANGFFVYTEDGTRTAVANCVRGTNNTTVTCDQTSSTSATSQFAILGNATLATVAQGAVTGSEQRTTANGAAAFNISNHEERAAL